MITLNFGSTFLRETGPISVLHTIDYMQFGRWASAFTKRSQADESLKERIGQHDLLYIGHNVTLV